MDNHSINSHSSEWDFMVKVAFGIAVVATLSGIYLMPGPVMAKGYFLISALFLVFSSITMTKTVRDRHESNRLHNKISEARTSQMIRELDKA